MKIVTGANSQGAKVLEVPLFELDHNEDMFNNLTSVFVPKITRDEDMYTDFDFAVYIIDHLVDDEKAVRGIVCKRTNHLNVIY